MKKTQRIVVRQYEPNGPWHLVREDEHTVCGKNESCATMQQAGVITANGVRGTALKVDRVCANCERMRGADTVRLKRPGAGS